VDRPGVTVRVNSLGYLPPTVPPPTPPSVRHSMLLSRLTCPHSLSSVHLILSLAREELTGMHSARRVPPNQRPGPIKNAGDGRGDGDGIINASADGQFAVRSLGRQGGYYICKNFVSCFDPVWHLFSRGGPRRMSSAASRVVIWRCRPLVGWGELFNRQRQGATKRGARRLATPSWEAITLGRGMHKTDPQISPIQTSYGCLRSQDNDLVERKPRRRIRILPHGRQWSYLLLPLLNSPVSRPGALQSVAPLNLQDPSPFRVAFTKPIAWPCPREQRSPLE
jgi:hypothetical protein